MAEEKTERVNERLILTSKTGGLLFGTDAYLLSAYLRRRPRGRAVDLGAGTGVVSMLCAARDCFERIVCVEIQETFCDLIRRNIADNALENKMEVFPCDVRALTREKLGFEADAVFSNPPYFRASAGFSNESAEKNAARHEIFGGIADFCAAAARILKFGGYFTVVYRPERLAELFSAMRGEGLEPKRLTMIHADSAHAPSLVLAEAKKGASPDLFVTKPLFLRENGQDSAEIKSIYENGAFHEQYQKP